MNSRRKGACMEREAAAAIAQHLGVKCSRMGRNGRTAEDLDHTLTGVHLEIKSRKGIAAMEWLEQAEADCGGKVPVVVMRENRGEWTAMVRLADLMELCRRVAAKGE